MFFRASIIELGRSLGLTGWVRNRMDGAVEAVAEGPEPSLNSLRSLCKKGPPGSLVHELQVVEETATGEFAGFRVRPDG